MTIAKHAPRARCRFLCEDYVFLPASCQRLGAYRQGSAFAGTFPGEDEGRPTATAICLPVTAAPKTFKVRSDPRPCVIWRTSEAARAGLRKKILFFRARTARFAISPMQGRVDRRPGEYEVAGASKNGGAVDLKCEVG